MLFAFADGNEWRAEATEGGQRQWGDGAGDSNWDEPYGGEGSGGCYYGTSSQPHHGNGGGDEGCYAGWEEGQYDPSYVSGSPSPLHTLCLAVSHYAHGTGVLSGKAMSARLQPCTLHSFRIGCVSFSSCASLLSIFIMLD